MVRLWYNSRRTAIIRLILNGPPIGDGIMETIPPRLSGLCLSQEIPMQALSFSLDAFRAADVSRRLCEWYAANRRDLPWRHTRDPYAVWVCEMMAQQTRITALLPYYRRFMELFPELAALARADEQQVLKAWEGLGYYARPRNMLKAARIIQNELGGRFPCEETALRSLPGIGAYTAGAILSIAFDLPVPAVDGNVLRVFARVQESELDIAAPAGREAAAGFVTRLMPHARPGILTQSLMELGALICLPKRALCDDCPLAGLCLAQAHGRQEELPRKSAKKPPRPQDKTALILQDPGGRLLVRQRAERLLCGLWEFWLQDGALTPEEADALLRGGGYTPGLPILLGEAEHVFTHLIWRMRGYLFPVSETHAPPGFVWKSAEELDRLPMPGALGFYLEKLSPQAGR
jgi:A/G-specific adenine glycosylase